MSDRNKTLLLCLYASGTLSVHKRDGMDATSKKLLKRLDDLDRQIATLRVERTAITTALSVAGLRPPAAHSAIYTHEENDYLREQPFKSMSLTDCCLKVLRDHAEKDEAHEQWLDKNQVEYLVQRGGFVFKTGNATNSVNITLRRLAEAGYCEAHGGKGSRPVKYHYRKERLPNEVEDSRTTKR